jgi:hypothetical protein
MAEEKENKNQIATLDQKMSMAKSVKDLFEIPDVKETAIRGYIATTGRKDGEAKFQQERYAYMEIIHQKPELRGAQMWMHFKVIGKVMRNGWSLRDNRIYLQVVKRGDEIVDIKVDPSPAVRREMLEAMRTDTRNGIRGIKEVPEAQVVVKGDIFIEDKLNHKILKHEATEKSLQPDNLDNVLYSYQRIIWEDGKINDVVVPHHDLVKAKSKSKIKGEGGVWEFVAEACKKTATNRAFRLYHKYANSLEVVDKLDKDDDDDTKDTAHTVVDPEPDYTTQSGEQVDTDTGEVTQELKIEKSEKAEKDKKKDKPQYNLLD